MNGLLVIHKEKGMTSHDVVFRLRKILQIKKIGHTGTLDPNATGVLLVMVGKATKLLPFLEDIDKEYIATLGLGKKTLSDDVWGEVLHEKEIIPIDDLNQVLQSFVGVIKQVPPRISSIKIAGKKLYEYTRKGEMIRLPKRDVEIFSIVLLDSNKRCFKVHCSSGTYVRSLCVAIAEKTQNLGYMDSLVRSKVGRFALSDASTLADVEKGNYRFFSKEEVLKHLPFMRYEPIEDIYHGKKINLETMDDRVVICDKNQMCLAIYDRVEQHTFKSVRGLW
ncbi:MAG: tRNA pseudouridine(55) synthase TruB [Breznakia sp.]